MGSLYFFIDRAQNLIFFFFIQVFRWARHIFSSIVDKTSFFFFNSSIPPPSLPSLPCYCCTHSPPQFVLATPYIFTAANPSPFLRLFRATYTYIHIKTYWYPLFPLHLSRDCLLYRYHLLTYCTSSVPPCLFSSNLFFAVHFLLLGGFDRLLLFLLQA